MDRRSFLGLLAWTDALPAELLAAKSVAGREEALLPRIEVGESPLALHVKVYRDGVDDTDHGMYVWVDESSGTACRYTDESVGGVHAETIVERGNFRVVLHADAPRKTREEYERLRRGEAPRWPHCRADRLSVSRETGVS